MNFMRPPLNSAQDIERAIHKIQYYPLSQQHDLAGEINRKVGQLQAIGVVKNDQDVAFKAQLARYIMTKPAAKGMRTWETRSKSNEATPITTPSDPVGSTTDALPVSTEAEPLADNSSTASTPETSTPPSTLPPVLDLPSSTMTSPEKAPLKKAGKK